MLRRVGILADSPTQDSIFPLFDRFTERARHAIHFARIEAFQFGVRSIETHHLLLGLFRADSRLASRILEDGNATTLIREEFKNLAVAGDKIPLAVDIPLSQATKRVLAYAEEEAERTFPRQVAVGHMLLGLLREKAGPAYEALSSRLVSLAESRRKIAQEAESPGTESPELFD